jgi:hypothetical protein
MTVLSAPSQIAFVHSLVVSPTATAVVRSLALGLRCASLIVTPIIESVIVASLTGANWFLVEVLA